jgi:hypothetical protein
MANALVPEFADLAQVFVRRGDEIRLVCQSLPNLADGHRHR